MNGINDLDLNDYIRYQIRTLSNAIHNMKAHCALPVLGTYTRRCYIDPKTNKPYVLTKPLTDAEIDEKKLVWDDYTEETHDHIKPCQTVMWNLYVDLKRDVSLWLATLHVSKGHDDKVKCHTQDLAAAKKRFERTFKMIKKFNSGPRSELRNVSELEKIQKEIKEINREKALRIGA
jgi:hypothetical protein